METKQLWCTLVLIFLLNCVYSDNNIDKQLDEVGQKITSLKQQLANITSSTVDLGNYLDNLLKQTDRGGHFVPPDRDRNSTKIVKLLNRIKYLQDNITKLNNDLNNHDGDVNEIKTRTTTLETELENLIRQIDAEKRNSDQSLEKYDALIANLTSSYRNLVNELTKRLNEMEESLPLECIDAIISKNYYSAEMKINKVPDNKMKFIVEQVCSQGDANCDTLFILGHKLITNKKFSIYKELVDLAVKKNTDSYCFYMKLIRLLESEIVFGTFEERIRSEALKLVDKLVNRFKYLLNLPYVSQVSWHCTVDANVASNPIKFTQDCYGSKSNYIYNVLVGTDSITCTQENYTEHGY